MAKNISIVKIDASLNKVWNALTNPALVRLWQYGSEVTTDWKTGSEIKFRAEWQGQVFEQWGKILEIIPETLIKYNLFAPRTSLEDKPENYFEMSYLLNPIDTQTQLTIIQDDNRPGAKQQPPQGEENEVLQALKLVAETQA